VTGAHELLTPRGQQLLASLAGQDVAPEHALRLAESLRGSYPPELVAAALTQLALRAAARSRFSLAGRMLFTRPGLEQASSEAAARHSAARYAGAAVVADLCCGIGGNLMELAPGRRVLAADADPVALAFARHNAGLRQGGGQVAAVRSDVRELSLRGIEAVFIDPARRAGERRFRAGHSEPPLGWCLGLAGQVPAVGIKAAPGLPRELVPAGWEAEFVAIGRGLKEALLWSPALATVPRRATVLHQAIPAAPPPAPGTASDASPPPGNASPASDASPAPDAAVTRPAGPVPADTLLPVPGQPVPVAPPGRYLLDPNPAVTRAGLVEDLARLTGGWKIDPMIAFLSSDQPVRTPFARTLRVLLSARWNERRFAAALRELGIGSADIRRRGLAGDVEQIRKRLGLRGGAAGTIVITRMNGTPWGLICTAPDDQAATAAPGQA
jgi:hypothetical protein